MMRVISLAIFMALVSCQDKPREQTFIDSNWVDLSYSFDSATLYWPNNLIGFEHKTDAKGFTPGGFYYSSYSILTPEHGGTHLDAPVHFAEKGLSLDELPLENLTGNAIVIDVSSNALKNRDYQITIADIEKWELMYGEIKPNTIILFKTGYGEFYPDREKYFGTAKKGLEAIPELHFPGIHPETTQFLVEKRNVKALGIDTPSIDFGQSKDFKTHQILLGANRPAFENVASLNRLPPQGLYVVALPMKIGQGSGGPLRIIAQVHID